MIEDIDYAINNLPAEKRVPSESLGGFSIDRGSPCSKDLPQIHNLQLEGNDYNYLNLVLLLP